jgi:uncharacterized protein YndB with AHSA1/START domain
MIGNAGGLQVSTPSDREIRVVRQFDAPRRLVFECWTTPALLQRWMSGPDGWTLTVCEIDLRVGGAYRFVWRGPDGNDMGMRGIYREIVVPERVVGTEVFDHDWTGGETLGTIEFSERAGRTTLTQTLLYASKEARDGALASGMAEGMSAGFDRLAEFMSEQRAGQSQ